MKTLRQRLLLDEAGEKELIRSVIACALSGLSLMIPFSITLMAVLELLAPLTGGAVDWDRMWLLFGAGAAAFGVIFLLSKSQYQKTYVVAYRQSEATRLAVAEHMRRLPMSFFNSRDLSELSSNLMGDCTSLEEAMSNIIPQMIADVITAVLICGFLAFWDWQMALAVFFMLPVSVLVFLASRKLQERLFSRHVKAKRRAEKETQEYLDGMKVIRACAMGGGKLQELERAFGELRRMAIRVELGSGSVTALSTMLLRSGIGIAVFVGISLLVSGKIDFFTLFLFLLISSRIYGPLLTTLTMLPDLLYLKVSTGRLGALMESAPMAGREDAAVYGGEISFRQVSFSYGKEAVLKDVTFTAPEGKVTALVGPSGSGKSTVSRLAARFWDADAGSVLVGGTDVKTLEPEVLMRQFSFVFQDVILFHDTLENNIRIGKPGASKEEIRRAAKAACCEAFIEKLPDGYETMLGENGATLSGGERQRISIARALLKDAPIVVLDEASAALDPENEAEVQQAINRLAAGKTVLVIAHRLRTIAAADHIVVLENGRVAEQGTHRDLMARQGLYARLFSIQAENGEWSMG